MQIFKRFAAIAMLGAIVASPVYADDTAAKTTVTVNGVVIPQSRIDVNIKAAVSQGQEDTPELRKMVIDRLVDIEMLSQEATKEGLGKDAEIQQRIEFSRESVMAGALIQKFVEGNNITDAEIKAGYDKMKESLGSKELDVRHILVKTEAEAKSVAAKLKKGAQFDKLAMELSQDAGSKENGGDLGWVPKGNISAAFVKPFADAVLALKKGETSAPVESKFGWHIIQVKDERDLKLPPLDEVKPKILQRLQQEAVKNYVDGLREKAKIEE